MRPPTFGGRVTDGLSKIYSAVNPTTRVLETKGVPTHWLIIRDETRQREFCVLTETTVSVNEILLKLESKKERLGHLAARIYIEMETVQKCH